LALIRFDISYISEVLYKKKYRKHCNSKQFKENEEICKSMQKNYFNIRKNTSWLLYIHFCNFDYKTWQSDLLLRRRTCICGSRRSIFFHEHIPYHNVSTCRNVPGGHYKVERHIIIKNTFHSNILKSLNQINIFLFNSPNSD
jgi:hypothetical protein